MKTWDAILFVGLVLLVGAGGYVLLGWSGLFWSVVGFLVGLWVLEAR